MTGTVLKTEHVKLDRLEPHPSNPRQGNVDAIADSIRAHGQYRAIVANKRTGHVLAGNHTLLALRQLGHPTALVHWVDVDDQEAARIVLVDNRANDQATYNNELLLELLQSLPDLHGTGYDPAALAALLPDVLPGEKGDTEPAPLPTGPTRTKPGDVWRLGPHVLVCGDATSLHTLDQLAPTTPIDCMWTDPPYGVSYTGKTRDRLTIRNDDADGLHDLLYDTFTNAATVLKPGAAFYIAHPAGPLAHTFQTVILELDWRWHETLVWVKNSMVLGHSDYHYRHEPILYGQATDPEPDPTLSAATGYQTPEHDNMSYGYLPTSERTGRGHTGWYGDNKQTTVLQVARPKASRDHPTMKPVELIEHCVRNSTPRTGSILDPFAGSGSTLIAAHNLGRTAYLTEIDPRYCDVILDRYERHTNHEAQRT